MVAKQEIFNVFVCMVWGR